MLRIRLAGVGLIAMAALVAFLFVYLPIHNGPRGFMGPVRLNALVFVPLSFVTGAAFVAGGTPVLEAFQARPRSNKQLTLVLTILIGSFVLTGIGYWQVKTNWLRPVEPVILDSSPRVPILPNNR